MKRLLPLYVALLALNGWAQTLESNVRTALVQLELDTKVEVVSVGPQVYLRPLGDKDAIRQWLKTHHARVRRQVPLVSRWYHNSSESYRVVARPSLHVSWRPEYGVWDAHLDKWCPRFSQPGTILGHLLEIGRNIVTRHATSQVEIWRLLNRRQPDNAPKHSRFSNVWKTTSDPVGSAKGRGLVYDVESYR
jgi:hypothetical protein